MLEISHFSPETQFCWQEDTRIHLLVEGMRDGIRKCWDVLLFKVYQCFRIFVCFLCSYCYGWLLFYILGFLLNNLKVFISCNSLFCSVENIFDKKWKTTDFDLIWRSFLDSKASRSSVSNPPGNEGFCVKTCSLSPQ